MLSRSGIRDWKPFLRPQRRLRSERSILKQLNTRYRKNRLVLLNKEKRSQLGGLAFLYFPIFLLSQMTAALKANSIINASSLPRPPAARGRGICPERGLCPVWGLIRTHGPQRVCGVGWPADGFSIRSLIFFSSHFPHCTKITPQKSIYLSCCHFTACPH